MDHNQKSIGDAINEYLNRSRLRPQLDAVAVKGFWEEVVGVFISNRTTDILLQKDRLIVYIDGSAIKAELMFEKENIVERLNEKLGSRLISELVIK